MIVNRSINEEIGFVEWFASTDQSLSWFELVEEAYYTPTIKSIDSDMASQILTKFHKLSPDGEVWPPELHGQLNAEAMRDAINELLMGNTKEQ